MRKYFYIKLLLFLSIINCHHIQANNEQDSLYGIWIDDTNTDSARSKALYLLSLSVNKTSRDSSWSISDILEKFAKSSNNPWTHYYWKRLSIEISQDTRLTIFYGPDIVKITQELNFKEGEGIILMQIGAAYSRIGMEDSTLQYYDKAERIFEKTGYKVGIGRIKINYANTYAKVGYTEKAIEFNLEGASILEKENSSEFLLIAYDNLAKLYTDENQDSLALRYFDLTDSVAKHLNYDQGIAKNYNSLGVFYQQRNQLDTALTLYKKALELFSKNRDLEGQGNAANNLGIYYLKKKEYDLAHKYCRAALKIYDLKTMYREQLTPCKCLYEISKAQENETSTLFYLEKIKVIEDSLKSMDLQKEINHLIVRNQIYKDSVESANKEVALKNEYQKEIDKEQKRRNIALTAGFIFLSLTVGIYRQWLFVKKSKARLQTEKDRSESLLLNILPAEIAEELKIHGKADARDFDIVSILFSDFKGFTQASAKLSAQDLVKEINTCFKAFDGIMEKYGIEKIKTIGDAYMAAGGLPVPTDDSIKNTVLAALEIQTFIEERKKTKEERGASAFEMRVGIHTGPVVAGIVGVKKFQYDIWGDTVNTASRMESSGEVGKVNISQATYELLKTDADFAFESRGKIQVKGKGLIEMWFVSKS